jgi:hypothetical protein
MADQTTTFIQGRSARTALLLLTAAAQLELDKHVVRSQMRGYVVPTEVAERYEVLLEELESEEESTDPEPEPEPDPEPEPARKRATKKTAASTRTQE